MGLLLFADNAGNLGQIIFQFELDLVEQAAHGLVAAEQTVNLTDLKLNCPAVVLRHLIEHVLVLLHLFREESRHVLRRDIADELPYVGAVQDEQSGYVLNCVAK